MFNFKSKITAEILRYFFLNPNERGHINGLARILTVDAGNLSRKLGELEKEGILISEYSGNQRYYSLNGKYPLLKEARKIFESKYGLAGELAVALKKIKGIKEARIYGSYAKGDFSAASDIDLLIIGSHDVFKAGRALRPLENKLGREINVVDMTEEELKKRQASGDEFIVDVFGGKTVKII